MEAAIKTDCQRVSESGFNDWEACWLRDSLRLVLFIEGDFWNECKYKEGSCDPLGKANLGSSS